MIRLVGGSGNNMFFCNFIEHMFCFCGKIMINSKGGLDDATKRERTDGTLSCIGY